MDPTRPTAPITSGRTGTRKKAPACTRLRSTRTATSEPRADGWCRSGSAALSYRRNSTPTDLRRPVRMSFGRELDRAADRLDEGHWVEVLHESYDSAVRNCGAHDVGICVRTTV